MKKPKKIPLNISLEPEVKEAAENLAEKDDRSISNFIGKLIKKAEAEHKAASNATS